MINISLSQALMMIKEKNVAALDVQLEEDYRMKRLPNCIHIPIESLKEYAPIAFSNKQTPIIVYCQRGIRSRVACDMLSRMGYQNLYNIHKGIDEKW